MGVNYQNLIKLVSQPNGKQLMEGAFKEKSLKPDQFEIGKLFAECFGHHEFNACRSSTDYSAVKVMEAAGAVSTNAFQNISGQIVFSATMEAYDQPEFLFTKLIPTVPTQFNGEKIPGITNIGNEAAIVQEGDPYPIAGVSEDYIETPPTAKRGFIVPVTREAVFFDRTGLLLDRCRDVGNWLGYNRELRAVDCLIDENGGAVSAMLGGHRYHWRGNSIASYGDSSGTHNWDNLQASNALSTYINIENAEILLAGLTDPNTGVLTGKYRGAAQQIVVPTSLVHTARQIVSATEIRLHAGGYATSGSIYERSSGSTLQNYAIVNSPLVEFRLATKTSWFLGNIGKALRYMENWPMQVKQAPANSSDEFSRDIVLQFRADERGAYTTFDPRYLVKSTVA